MEDRRPIPITILICDDDAGGRILTRQVLEGARIANPLQFTENGEQLLDYLYQRGEFAGETGKAPRPGLILLNCDGSRPGGPDALTVIRQDKRLLDIPVVQLAKPISFPRLLDAVHAAGRYWLEIVAPPLPPDPAWAL